MDSSLGSEMLAVAPGGAAEEPLIEESVWGAVRALRERGLSKKEIGRQLDLDIKTVRKWLRQKWEPQRRSGRGRALDRWEGFLRGRSAEVGFNAAVLHRELQVQGYEGSYPSLVRYLRPWRGGDLCGGKGAAAFPTGPGRQGPGGGGGGWGGVG